MDEINFDSELNAAGNFDPASFDPASDFGTIDTSGMSGDTGVLGGGWDQGPTAEDMSTVTVDAAGNAVSVPNSSFGGTDLFGTLGKTILTAGVGLGVAAGTAALKGSTAGTAATIGNGVPNNKNVTGGIVPAKSSNQNRTGSNQLQAGVSSNNTTLLLFGFLAVALLINKK